MQLRTLLCYLIGVLFASIPYAIVKGQSTTTVSGNVPVVDLNTMYVAVYGAILSTMLLIFTIYSYIVAQNEKKPKIRVSLSMGFLSEGYATSAAMLFLEAVNAGHVPVTLTTIPSLILPNARQLILTEAEADFTFPHTLAPGTSCKRWREIKQIALELAKNGLSGKVRIVGQFKDALDNSYTSKPFRLDIDEWAKSPRKRRRK